MDASVKTILPRSPVAGTIIKPGDVLKKINGHKIADVLDYKYYSYERDIYLELMSADGGIKLVRLRKPEGADIGLEFDSFLMDKERSCANKCIFCFIDQLPKGMRRTLYYKDDDMRLSFLQGNYITLTNLTKSEIERIIRLRISPINISVHTMNPGLRTYMLGNRNAGEGICALTDFAKAGIIMNCQIVCCPGINDESELQNTMEALKALTPGVGSVSVVPVGLTSHRDGLKELRPFDRELANITIAQVETFAEKCFKELGTSLFFCADELYIKAGLPLPPHEYYENYPQLENGVGMMRLFITEFENELKILPKLANKMRGIARERKPFSVVTGAAAYKYLTNLLYLVSEKYDNIKGAVYEIKNRFFGEDITVSGLITGGDIAAQLRGCELGSRLLIPRNMLKSGEEIFLDDLTVPALSKILGIPVRVVEQDGADLLHAFLGG